MTQGRCRVDTGEQTMALRADQFFDPPGDVQQWTITASTDGAECLFACGHLGPANRRLWTVVDEPDATNSSDPVDYPGQTRIDNHYHDYHEYWFILDGAATVVVSHQPSNLVFGRQRYRNGG